MPFAMKEHQTAVLETTRTPARIVSKTVSYTPVLADANKVIEADTTSANTLLIPTNTAVAFDIGVVIGVYQQGSGLTTVAADTGVILRSSIGQSGSRALSGQFAEASIRKRGANDWVLVGDLA